MLRRIEALMVVAVLFAGLALPRAGRAAFVCYDESRLPSVKRVQRVAHPFEPVVAYLGGRLVEEPPNRLPMIQLMGKGRFRRVGAIESMNLVPMEETCRDLAFDVSLTIEEARRLRPDFASHASRVSQGLTGCHERDGYLWFGVSFYQGEGEDGVGGLGRYHLESGKLEIRRPERLRGVSSDHVTPVEGGVVFGTTNHYECAGLPPAEGVLFYDWDDDRLRRVETCGLVAHSILSNEGGRSVWIGTDLGLSHVAFSKTGPYRVSNYLPNAQREGTLPAVDCRKVLQGLLFEEPQAIEGGDGQSDSRSQLKQYYERIYPDVFGGAPLKK